MDAKKRCRRAARAQVSKISNILENLLDKDELKISEIELNYLVLQGVIKKLEVLDRDIEMLLAEKDYDESGLEKEYEEVIAYNKKWLTMKTRVENVLSKTKEESVGFSGSETAKNYKLPVLELRKFDGCVRSWLPFWGQFQKIDEDKQMNDANKFQYLVQSMMPGTEVRSFVESFPPNKSSYTQCLSDLKRRYAREELLIQVYVRELLTLIINKDKNMNLSNLYDQLNSQLRALETLGVTQDKYAAFILPMVESSLLLDILKA
ncbi:uncharacterized protein LOC128201705 [Galleria mellonella]|uniref:Uncharacterized protein LOC128201705 n=1 Tax=Galleria mellonella TaxID=7137 RepID=A0ABM3MVJ2_GALME|nr:uncharacterized protein LOC128201705 [Galleria mellonella]